MNFIQGNMTVQEYILLKNWAYNSVEYFRNLSMVEKYNFLKSLPFKDKVTLDIFLATLFLPNDLELITLFSNNKNIEEIAKQFNVPINVIVRKKLELQEMDIAGYIKEGKIKEQSALQRPIQLTNDDDDIDELLLVVFPEQPYIAYKQKEEIYAKEKIINMLTIS